MRVLMLVNNINKNVKLEKLKNHLNLTCYFEYFLFFFNFYLFIYDSHREREREREREPEIQAEGEAGSMHREPDVGFDPGSPGSRPGPKAGAKLLRHPGIPTLNIFYNPFSKWLSASI